MSHLTVEYVLNHDQPRTLFTPRILYFFYPVVYGWTKEREDSEKKERTEMFSWAVGFGVGVRPREDADAWTGRTEDCSLDVLERGAF